jgi:predicted transcriptional regulator
LAVSKIALLDAISRAMDMFKSVASASSSTDVLITELKLTRKQYYLRMSCLIQAGLVKRKAGKYVLTAFGRVISSAYMNFESQVENALKIYWKLKAIDSLEVFSKEEFNKIISTLIDNQEIRDVLMKEELKLSIEQVSNNSRRIRDTLVAVNTKSR